MTLREEVKKAAFLYATNRQQFLNEFGNTIHEIYLHDNFSDANFSSLAESIPLELCQWKLHEHKHQYDGYRGESYDSSKEFCECKPEKAINKSKLNGHATWNDITIKKVEKLKNDNLTLMFTGWIDGNLMYVVTIPHNYQNVINKLEEQVKSAIDNHKPRINGSMTWKTWIDCQDIRIEWLADESIWQEKKGRYNKKFYAKLKDIKALKQTMSLPEITSMLSS